MVLHVKSLIVLWIYQRSIWRDTDWYGFIKFYELSFAFRPIGVLSMMIFRLLMVVLRLTLVKSAESVNLVSAGRMGDWLRSMDTDCRGVGWCLNLSPHRRPIRFLLWHDWCNGVDWVVHALTHGRLYETPIPLHWFPMTKYEPWNLPLWWRIKDWVHLTAMIWNPAVSASILLEMMDYSS